MKLYGSLTSPYVRKVRAFAVERGIALEFVTEGPRDAAGNVARLNPLGKVPLLVRDDGEVLFDSPFIIDFLDGLQGRPSIPAQGEARWRRQRWHALAQGICDAVVARLMETRREAPQRDAALIAHQEGKVAAALAFAEGRAGGGESLEDGAFGAAEIALAVALEYIDLRYAHGWRPGHPRLASWLSRCAERPCLRETRFPA